MSNIVITKMVLRTSGRLCVLGSSTSSLGHNITGHHYMDHSYIGHTYMGHNCTGHNSICNNCTCHEYIGRRCVMGSSTSSLWWTSSSIAWQPSRRPKAWTAASSRHSGSYHALLSPQRRCYNQHEARHPSGIVTNMLLIITAERPVLRSITSTASFADQNVDHYRSLMRQYNQHGILQALWLICCSLSLTDAPI